MGAVHRGNGTRFSGPEEVSIALGAVAAMNDTIRHADGKAGTLAAIQAGMAAVVSAGAGMLSSGLAADGMPVRIAVTSVTAAFLCGFLMSARYLVQAVRPRLDRAPVPSRFGIATLVRMDPDGFPGAQAASLCREAWALAKVLAGIAMRKNRCVAKAIPWFSLMLGALAGLALLILLIRA
jgi:hypothetical protein